MRLGTSVGVGAWYLGALCACSGEVGSESEMPAGSATPSGTPAVDSMGNPIPGVSLDVDGNPVPIPPGSGTPATPTIDASGNPVTPMPTGGVTPAVPDPGAPATPGACQSMPAPQGLVMLTDIQFVNGIRAAIDDAALTADNLPVEEQKDFSRKVLALNASLVFKRMDWAEDAGASLAGRVPEVTGCSDGDVACAQGYLSGLAERAFRRTVTDEEVTDIMEVFAAGAESSHELGVRLAVEAILASPSFFYRTEFGQVGADSTLQLTSVEMASALSYLLTDRPPDTELLADGISGALTDTARVSQHADRLLELESTRTNLTSTLMAAWSFGNLAGVTKDEMLFPTFNALRPRMYQETKLFLEDVLWTRNADVSEVLSSNTTFVDQLLAEHYGVPFPGSDPNEFVPVTLPAEQRAGLLTHASVMSARSRTDKTSVVSRGIFVRGDLLCLDKIPFPDGDPALAPLISAQEEDVETSEREKAAVRAADTTCGTCHSQFDPFGLPLEFYDPVGRYVAQGDDVSVDLSAIGQLEPAAPVAADGVELALALAGAPQFRSCMTRHMMSYGLGSDELKATSCEVQNAVASLPSSPDATTMTDILRAVAVSPAFRTRAPDSTP